MSKDNKGGNNNYKGNFKNKLAKMQQVRQELEKESKRIVVECSHQNEKGKLKIRAVSNNGDYECKYCGAKFNMNPISRNTLADATETLHNAIQQIRCYSDIHSDAKLIHALGEIDYNIGETGELYDRVTNVYGKGNGNKKKKNKNRGDGGGQFGSYGSGSLSFINGGK
jgi:hypothetical protein